MPAPRLTLISSTAGTVDEREVSSPADVDVQPTAEVLVIAEEYSLAGIGVAFPAPPGNWAPKRAQIAGVFAAPVSTTANTANGTTPDARLRQALAVARAGAGAALPADDVDGLSAGAVAAIAWAVVAATPDELPSVLSATQVAAGFAAAVADARRPPAPRLSNTLIVPTREFGVGGRAYAKVAATESGLADGPFRVGWCSITQFGELIYVRHPQNRHVREQVSRAVRAWTALPPGDRTGALPSILVICLLEGWTPGAVRKADEGRAFPALTRRWLSAVQERALEHLELLDGNADAALPTGEQLRSVPRALLGLAEDLDLVRGGLDRLGEALAQPGPSLLVLPLAKERVEECLAEVREQEAAVRATMTALSSTASAHQATASEKQRRADSRFQTALGVFAALVAVPGLIAAIYGAEVAVPFAGSGRATGLLLLSMLLAAALSLAAISTYIGEESDGKLVRVFALLVAFVAALALLLVIESDSGEQRADPHRTTGAERGSVVVPRLG